MTLPRDISGKNLVSLLRKYGYEVSRQTGSHIRLTSRLRARAHHVTIPAHKTLKLGTLHHVITDVAIYLEMPAKDLIDELFD